jgi:hypothetical protein
MTVLKRKVKTAFGLIKIVVIYRESPLVVLKQYLIRLLE